jgi:hypothetical protein
MNRTVTIVVRILLILVLLSGVGALLTQQSLDKTLNELDNRYLPCKSSLQGHAERLALHFSNRLMQPPLPVLANSLAVPADSLKYASFNFPPHLATADLPERYPLSWSKSQGWLCTPPPVQQQFYERFFMRTANRPGWTTPTTTTMVMDPEDRTHPMILAGTWAFADNDASFHGALTPVDAFYDVYAQCWFDEYCHATFGQFLNSWPWMPTEFRLIPHNVDRDPIVLRESSTVDMTEVVAANDLGAYSKEAAEIAAMVSPQINPAPGWRDEAEWFEAALFPIPDKIIVASPFRMDLMIEQRSQMLTWWAMAAIVLAILAFPVTWIKR